MRKKISLESIEREENDLKKKLSDLNDKKRQLNVSDGNSIICSLCKRYIDHPNGNEKKEGICWHCITERGKEKKRKELLNRLKGALIVDLKIENASGVTLKSVTFSKDELLFDLTADGDYDGDSCDCWISLDENRTISNPSIAGIVDRPGAKPRSNDKVLDVYKMKEIEGLKNNVR